MTTLKLRSMWPQRPLLFRYLSILCCLCATMFTSNPAFSQTFPASCGPVNCTSNDVRVISAYLSGPDNSPIDCAASNPFASAELHLTIFSNTQRIGVSISGEFITTGAGAGSVNFAHCFTGITLNAGGNNNLSIPFPLPDAICGDGFSLKNLFVSWGTGNTDFCDASTAGHCPETKAKCRFVENEEIPVTVKLEVDFTSLAGVCADDGNSRKFTFTPQITTEKNIVYPVTFTWDFGDGTTPLPTTTATSAADVANATITHTYTSDGNFTVTLVGSDASPNAPVFSVTAIHTVFAVACCNLSAPSGGDKTECVADPVQTLTAEATGQAGETITWFDAPTGGNEVADPSLNHVGTVTYYAEASTSNCVSPTRTAVTLTINAKTTPTFNAIDPICSGGSFTLPDKSKEDIPGTWAPAIDNTKTTEYTFTPADGECATTATLTVTVKDLPTVSADDKSVCTGGSVGLTGTPVGGTWSGDHVSGSTFDATGLTAGPYTVTYTVTGDNSCSNSDDATVTVNDLPTVSAGSDVSICNGGSTTLTASGATSYVWSPAGGLSATTGTSVTAHPTVTTTYTVTGTDGNTCSNSAQVKVTVNPVPSCDISNSTSSGSHSTTLGVSVNFGGPSGANYKYEWSFTSNTSGATFSGGGTTATTQNVTVTAATVGSYTLSLKVTDESYPTNCNKTCTYSMTIGPAGPSYTVTQGFYGNVGGKFCIKSGSSYTTYVAGTKGNVPGLISASITNMGGQLKLGIIPVTVTATSRTFIMGNTSTEDANLIKYLPAGQAATVITANSGSNNNTNITSNLPKIYNKKISDILLGQTITLALNVSIPGNTSLGSFVLKTGYLTTQKMDPNSCAAPKLLACTSDGSAISSLQITTNTGLKAWINTGKTVKDLLDLASNALGGANIATLTGQSGITLSDINNAVDVINRSFDGGRFFLGYYLSAKSCGSNLAAPVTNSAAIVEDQTITVTKLTVSAYPNPFSDKVKFSIVSPVSGKATLDVFNVMGQKVSNVYQGYLFAGTKKLIDYNVPSTHKGGLIYTLKIGDQQVSGKVVQVK